MKSLRMIADMVDGIVGGLFHNVVTLGPLIALIMAIVMSVIFAKALLFY